MTVASTARRKRLVAVAVAVVAAAALALYLLLSGDGAEDDGVDLPPPSGPVPTVNPSAVRLDTGPPPWDPPLEAVPYIRAAGLEPLPREALDVHYHAHLDVIVDDEPVIVPSGIGYVLGNGTITAISPLHTHDIRGVIHVESPTNPPYTLGQLFVEWAVRLDDECIGGLCATSTKDWRAYVNGDLQSGDPAAIVFRPHQEIALWYGDADADPDVPSSYEFAPGE